MPAKTTGDVDRSGGLPIAFDRDRTEDLDDERFRPLWSAVISRSIAALPLVEICLTHEGGR